jgi:ABC-type uncharacterized transport system substrate-binding protein
MDAKRRGSDAEVSSAARQIASKITTLKPDLIIVSDDPAQTYLVLPHLTNNLTPVVFTGVNWDATPYGYPRSGITGMVEVSAIRTLVQHLQLLAKGPRLAFIGGDDISERKNIAFFLDQPGLFPINPEVALVKNYKDFQRSFMELQTTVDAVIMLNVVTLPGWDASSARQWILENTRVVSGTVDDWMIDFVVVGVVKVPQEQGLYAGKTAIRILQGERPESIPIERNKQSSLKLNSALASQLHIVLPLSWLRAARSGQKL